MTFTGITQAHLDTYTEDKWSSMVHNLARMKTKDVMVALCQQAQEHLDLNGLQRATSDEIPNITNHKKVDAQWVYWHRGADERKSLAAFLEKTPLHQDKIFELAPHDKHISLTVVLRQAGLYVGLRLGGAAIVDRQNLAARLRAQGDGAKLLELLCGLPKNAHIGFEQHLVPVAELDTHTLLGWAEQLATSDEPWVVGQQLDADETTSFDTDLADFVGRWLGAVVPVYHFIAWGSANDHIGAIKELKAHAAQKKKQAGNYNLGDKVRVMAGLLRGQVGIVESTDNHAILKVRVGKMAVTVKGEDVCSA